MKRIKTVTSYTGHARLLAGWSEDPIGYLPRQPIPSPYRYSPTQAVYTDESGRRVFWVETKHRHYEVFALDAHERLYSESAAEAIYIGNQRGKVTA
jgi:hypothetical protein